MYVIRQTGPTNYILANCETRKEIPYAVNVERIKPFNDNRDVYHTYDAARYHFLSQPSAAVTTQVTNVTPIMQQSVSTTQTSVPTTLVSTTVTGSDSTPTWSNAVISTTNTNQTNATSSTTPTSTTSVQTQIGTQDDWEEVKEVTGVKMIDATRHYQIVWKNPNHAPSWVTENEVSDALKTEYTCKVYVAGHKTP